MKICAIIAVASMLLLSGCRTIYPQYRINEVDNSFPTRNNCMEPDSIRWFIFNDKRPAKVWMVEWKENSHLGWVVYSIDETEEEALQQASR